MGSLLQLVGGQKTITEKNIEDTLKASAMLSNPQRNFCVITTNFDCIGGEKYHDRCRREFASGK